MRLGLALLAVFGATALLTAWVQPGDSAGSVAAFEQAFGAACHRSGADEDRCRCALQRWNETLGEPRRVVLDKDLASGGILSDELRRAVAACR